MSFTAPLFLFAFLPIALAGYYLIKSRFGNIFLLIMSLLFYAWGEAEIVAILCASIVTNYIFALIIKSFKERKPVFSRIVMIFSLICNVGLLFVFKYLATTIRDLNTYFGFSLQDVNLILPFGISFFTFRAISYVLDVYFETSEAQKNIINVALYISFFPQLTMGPISKYSDFEKQFNNRGCTFTMFSNGAKRLIIGLAKKVIIADTMGIIVDKAYAQGSNLSVSFGWIAAIAYLFQLYYDFSGYSDMAIGLSNMFGFECPENFNYPYISKTIGEFWRRWHITLGNWLKSYLYTPVFRGIMGKKNPITKKEFSIQQCDIFSLLIVWICCGMWHGAGIKFLIYGLYYFVFIAGERIRQDRRKKRAKIQKLPKHEETKWESFKAHVYAIIVILFGQLLFRAPSFSTAISYLGSMFGLKGNAFIDSLAVASIGDNFIILLIALIFCMPISEKINKYCISRSITRKVSAVITPVLYAVLFIISITYCVNGSYNPFIYMNF